MRRIFKSYVFIFFYLMISGIFNMFVFAVRCIKQRNGIAMCILIDPLISKLQ